AVAPEERWRDEAGVHRTHQRIRPGALPGVEQRRFGGLTPGDARRGDYDARDENRGGWRKHRERSRRASAFGDLRNPAATIPGGTAAAVMPALNSRAEIGATSGSWRPTRGWVSSGMAGAISAMDHEPAARTADGARIPAAWDDAPDADDEVRHESSLPELRIYAHGISRKKLEVAIRELGLPASTARGPEDADAVMTIRNEFKQRGVQLVEAERRGVPIHVLKSNASAQMERALLALYDLPDDPREMALREAAAGVQEVMRTAHPVELAPQSAFIRRLQHQLAGEANITSSSRGRDPHRRVRLEPPGRASSTPRRRR
ncbi:MAG: R3H domain-containing nucleic acid-binding protein, partial [Candidatus Limnocylindrus sp.]